MIDPAPLHPQFSDLLKLLLKLKRIHGPGWLRHGAGLRAKSFVAPERALGRAQRASRQAIDTSPVHRGAAGGSPEACLMQNSRRRGRTLHV